MMAKLSTPENIKRTLADGHAMIREDSVLEFGIAALIFLRTD